MTLREPINGHQRAGEHINAVHWIHCENCGHIIASDRYELHRLLCKPKPEGAPT